MSDTIIPYGAAVVHADCNHRKIERVERRFETPGYIKETAVSGAKAERLLIRITPDDKATARKLGSLRTLSHEGKRKPGEDMGDAKNTEVDYVGMLGEVLVIRILLEAGWPITEYALFSHPTPFGPDFKLYKRTYNIKTVAFTGRRQFVCINEEQRRDPKKNSDRYLVVVLNADDTAYLSVPIPAADVAAWPLREVHSPFRSFPADKLTYLRSLGRAK